VRRSFVQIALVTVAATAVYLLTIRSGHPWGDDFVQYLQHSLNLSAGAPYGVQGYIANPERSIGPAAYPPVFPFVLLPVVSVFGANFIALKVWMSVLFGLALASIAFAFEPLLKNRTWILIVLLAAAPVFWDFKDRVLSDIPFLVFCYLSLALIERLVSAQDGRRKYLLAVATGILIYLACGTRSQGLVLLPTLMLADFWKAKRIRLAPIVACAVAVGLILVQSNLLFTEGDRFEYLTLDPAIVWSNVAHYAGALSTYWDDGHVHLVRYVVFAATLVLAIVGYGRRVRGGIGPFEIFLPLFMLPLLFWVFQQGIRYLLPIVPLYLLYVLEGVQAVAERLPPARARVFGASLLLASLGVFALRYATLDLRHIDGPLDTDAQALFEHVKASTDPSDVIVFEKPRVMNFFTGRRAAIPTQVSDATGDAAARDFYESIGADYLATSQAFESDNANLLPFLSRNPDWATEIWSGGEFQLWAIRKPPNPSAPRARRSEASD
jgi:hypothetical protein